MKELEGKTVFLKPTDNNTRGYKGYKGNKCMKAKIVKVARVFATFVIDGRDREMKYRFKGRHLNDECNGGYMVFESQQEIDDYEERNLLARKISESYRYSRDFEKVALPKLKQVAELLDI